MQNYNQTVETIGLKQHSKSKPSFSLDSSSPLHDGETVLFLSGKTAYRSASEKNFDTDGNNTVSMQSLIKNYLEEGGTLWLCKADAQTIKWYVNAIHKIGNDSPNWGMEYIVKDISKFIQPFNALDSEASSSMRILDPHGKKIGVIDPRENVMSLPRGNYIALSRNLSAAA